MTHKCVNWQHFRLRSFASLWLVWTVGLNVQTKLRFQSPPASHERGISLFLITDVTLLNCYWWSLILFLRRMVMRWLLSLLSRQVTGKLKFKKCFSWQKWYKKRKKTTEKHFRCNILQKAIENRRISGSQTIIEEKLFASKKPLQTPITRPLIKANIAQNFLQF